MPARRPKFRRNDGDGHLRVAIDVLPLVGQPSGVGAACRGLFEALAARDDVDLSAYAIARRAFVARREVGGARFKGRPIPTRLAQRAWQLTGFPSAERLTVASDVVHGTNFSVPPSRRAATVVTVHDMTAARYPELCNHASLSYPSLVKDAVARGAFVHVPSAFAGEETAELLKVDPDRIHVIPWGVPPVAEPTTAPPVEPPYLLALGTVEPRKDYPGLVEAFAEIGGSHPSLRLVLAGADGWGTDSLSLAVERHGLEDRVVRLGYVNEEERNALLWNAAALAYPSLYEGFGFPPLEAMAAGVPVVATRAGGVPEVVGEAAVLVEPRDSDALAAALASVLEDEALRTSLVAKGRERARSFSWEETAEKMVALYRLAASQPRR